MLNRYTIWIGLPAFNEEEAVKKVLTKIVKLKEKFKNKEIKVIIFNDGSTDDTIKNAKLFKKELNLILINNKKNQGLGIAVYSLLSYFNSKSSINDKLVLMDCDNTHNPKKVLEMDKKIGKKRNIVVIASRYQKGSIVKNVPFRRKILSHLAFLVLNIFYKTNGIRDFTSGYRMYDELVVKNFFLTVGKNYSPRSGFEMQLELILKLRKTDVKFDEIPIELDYKKKPTESKMKIFKTILNYLNLLIKKN